MSLVTLKKKSRHNRRIAPISGRGTDGFSLNGGHRNIGAVGQFRMISNTTRTPYRGTEPMGNGGSVGKYYNQPLDSGSCCTNDSSIIKASSKNTAGMIDTKYKWTKSAYPNFWVQEDDNSYRVTKDQATYIKNLTNKVGATVFVNVQSNGNCGTVVDSSNSDYKYSCSGNSAACSYFIGTKKYIRMPYAKNLNQPAMSQGQYINTGGIAKRECLPTPANKQPFPMNLNHSTKLHYRTNTASKSDGTSGGGGCQTNYLTWEDAKNAGALPSDWTPGFQSAGNGLPYTGNGFPYT